MTNPSWTPPAEDSLDRAADGLGEFGRRRLGEMAVLRGWITADQLNEVLQSRPPQNAPLGGLLIARGLLSPAQLIELLKEQRRQDLVPFLASRFPDEPRDVLEAQTDPDRCVDQYVLVEEIGRGGAGSIWKARDLELHRWVAVKFLRFEAKGVLERFVREARVAGRFNHPNIVSVYGLGRHNDVPYIAMQYVEGASVAGRPFPVRRALEIVRDAARALEVAHQHGILHRDIKPANLLLDAHGVVYVTDFGVARQLDAPVGVTIPGTILGTPSYMPPEQASGDLDRLGPAADVYSLGATLYELCTGRAPYEGAGTAEILAHILTEDPPRPRHRNPRLHRDIEAVILKAMARQPEHRYASAAALADDLDRYLEGQPIAARPDTARDRLRRALDRNPRLAGMLVALLLVALGIGAVMTGLAIQNLQLETESTRIEAESASRRRAAVHRDLQRRRAADLLRPAIDTLDLWEFRRATLTPTDRAATLEAIRAAFNAVPRFGPAWIEQGRLAWADGDFDAAQRAFTAAIDDPETAPSACYYRARLALARSSESSPHPFRVNDDAVLFMMTQRPETDASRTSREDARRDLDLFERIAPPDRFGPHRAFARALEQYVRANSTEEFKRIAGLFRNALKSRRIPVAETNLLLASACLYSGDYAGALAAIDAIIEDGIVDAQILDRRATILGAQATSRRAEGLVIEPLLREAAAAYRRARELAPDKLLLAVGESRVLLTIADLKSRANVDAVPVVEEALAILDSVVTEGPVSGPALTTRAQALRMRGSLRLQTGGDPLPDFTAAAADLNRAIEADPKDFTALNGLGGLYLLQSDYRRSVGLDSTTDLERAREFLSRALDRVKLPFILYNRSSVHLRMAQDRIDSGLDPAEALAAAERDASDAVALNPRYGDAFMNRGRVRMIRGEWQPACDDFRKALELNPTLSPMIEPALKECESRLERDF